MVIMLLVSVLLCSLVIIISVVGLNSQLGSDPCLCLT